MKLKKILALTALTAAAVPGLASCNKNDEPAGESVVQIKCYDGGYGHTWINELVKQFNETFKSEGLSARIEECSTNVTENSKNEMLNVERNQIDLYFTNGSDTTNLIQQKVRGYGNKVVFEQLDDLYNLPAIGFDGKEEEKTIGERLFKGYREGCQYNGYMNAIKGNLYKLPWAGAFTGIYANLDVLNKYGIQLPLTSNEFTSAVLDLASHTAADKIYPYAFGGANCAGYFSYLFETWFGQYSGQEKFINWMKCDPGDGNIKSSGYKVYQDIGIKKSLEGMFDILNLNYCPDKSVSMDHTDAQSKFVNGTAGFFVCGDWIMNEMKEDYGNKVNSIVMVQTPILSSIGTDNGLTDTELHNVIADIDAGKTDEEIKVNVPAANDAVIKKIRDARRVVDTIGTTHDTFIPSYSDAKEAAKKFLRMMYSNDGCNVFRKNALSNLPLEYTVSEENKAASSEFLKSLDKVYGSSPLVISASADYNQVRTQANILQFNEGSWKHVNTYKEIMKNKSKWTPQIMFDQEAAFVESQWNTWMKSVSWN